MSPHERDSEPRGRNPEGCDPLSATAADPRSVARSDAGPKDPHATSSGELFAGDGPWNTDPSEWPKPFELEFFERHERQLLRAVTHVEDRALRRERRARRWRHARALLRGGGSFGGRVGVIAAVLVAAGACAYGASSLLGGSGTGPGSGWAGPSAELHVASGDDGADRWTLSAWTRQGEICAGLVVADQEQSECRNSLASRVVLPLGLDSPTRRYFVGLTGAGVSQVRVSTGRVQRTAATHPLSTPATSGLPTKLRWFVVVIPRGSSIHEPPAHVLAAKLNR